VTVCQMPTQMFASSIMRVQRYGDRSACLAELKNQTPGRLYTDDVRIWTSVSPWMPQCQARKAGPIAEKG